MISLVISTMHPSPLLDLAISSHNEETHDDSLPSIGHVEVHQADITIGQSEPIAVG